MTTEQTITDLVANHKAGEPVALYRVITPTAPQMTGDYYSPVCVELTMREHERRCEPSDRKWWLPEGAILYQSTQGILCVELADGTAADVAEVIAPDGKVIDRKWGRTEAIAPQPQAAV